MDNQEPELRYAISDDKASITLSLGQEKLVCSTQEFENLLGNMGLTRAMMQPAVPLTPEHLTEAIQLQALYFRHPEGSMPVRDGAVLAARSNKFGWLYYELDPQFCQGIVACLTGQASEISAPAGASLN